MKNKLLLLFLILFNTAFVLGQDLTIKGKVIDENGDPLTGVTVAVQGTTTGTVTNLDGDYSIKAQSGKTLVFSYLGYKKENRAANGTTLNVKLIPDANQLDDVIVVAYGTASRAGYTGSASTVTSKEIANSQVSNVTRLLQGSASGVQSIASSGQPGSEAKIFIRGVGSVNAQSTPLYIVDGAPYDGDLSSLDPADIESINVLKDAASTALYGSRAANGLVVISTKKGRKGDRARIDARFTYGFSSRAVADYKKVSTDQYFELYWEAMRNQQMYINGLSPTAAAQYASSNITSALRINPYGSSKYPQPVGLDGKIVSGATPLWNDSWTDAYKQDAKRTDAQINISGGGDKSTYYVSLGYLNDEGIALASDFKRYTGRLNLNAELMPWLRLSTNIALTHSKQDAPAGDDSSTANTLFVARLIPDFYPVYQRNLQTGAYILDANGNRQPDYGTYRPAGAVPNQNAVGSSQYNFNRITRDIASIRAAADIDLYKGLVYRGSINIDYTNRNAHDYENPLYGPGSLNDIPGSMTKRNTRTTGFTGNNVLTYTTQIDKVHNLKVLAGQEYYNFNTDYIEGSRSGFLLLGYSVPDAASQLNYFEGYKDSYKILSFFGNAEYNYNYKYYGSLSVRRDGSSKFAKNNRWGTFWALGASWRISEENFLKDVPQITKLALRTSYGAQGNDQIDGYYDYMNLYDYNHNLGNPGIVKRTLANPNLKWETNLNWNLGVDYAFFDNRLFGAFEFFYRRSKDLLFTMPKATSTGYDGYIDNVGALKNVGYELSVTGVPVQTKDWRWSVSLNATHYKNTLTKLPQGQIESGTKLLREGGSIYDFFLVEWAGVDPEDGLPQWYMTNDNNERVKTKTYNDANNTKSKIIAGTSLPDLVGGFSTNLTYRDFEFSAMFAYSLGGKIYNQDKNSILANGTTAGRAMSTDLLNRWTPENTNTDVPRLQTTVSNSWMSSSTLMLVDADYLRLKNISIGYNLPKSILQKVNIERLKVFAQAENLFTVFGEQGLDPEQALNGVSYFRYPSMKTISFGLNLSF